MAATLEGLDAKLDAVCLEVQIIRSMLEQLDARLRQNELEIARMHEQLKLRSIMLAGLSSLLAAIAAALGLQR